MGLGTKKRESGIFLSVADRYFWDRSADKSHPDYMVQKFEYQGEEKERSGAAYEDILGTITDVYFRTHPKYGENINVRVKIKGERDHIISIATEKRYGQSMMKALLVIDFSKEVYMSPYDFVDKNMKRAQGISFSQDGEKINLRPEGMPEKPSDWFKNNPKREVKRFFDDLNYWLVSNIEEKICPLFVEDGENQVEKKQARENEVDETGEEQEDPKPTPLKMKKAIKAYIDENYAGKELPTLTKEELNEWYNLVLQEEELPFSDDEKEGEPNSEVNQSDLDNQLNSLLKK